MDTSASRLGDALLGRTRGTILALLLGRPDEEFHVRHVARLTGGAVGPVQKELKRLAGLGVLESRTVGRQLFYRMNRGCPLGPELTGLATKTFGVEGLIRTGLEALGRSIRVAFVFGSMARGSQRPDSDVDVMVIGDAKFSQVVTALREPQMTLGREVNPVVYTPGEFAGKLRAGSHFVTSVMAGEKRFLVGDEHELRRMAEERVGQAASDEPAGGRRIARSHRARPRGK